MREVELAIIGAGPAGISAAIEAAKSGCHVILIDENLSPGGQIYRQISTGFTVIDEKRLGKQYINGKKLLGEIEKYKEKIESIPNALIWGIFGEKELIFIRDGKNERLKIQKLILAEGAYDRPTPFRGWTLPGVFTAGGALRILKTERVLPGKKILLAGTGPLQLVLANQLAEAGAEVVSILEAASFNEAWKHVHKFWGQWSLVSDAWHYIRGIQKAKIPILNFHAVIEARGKEEVEEAVYAKVDQDCMPIPGTEKVVGVDTICVGYGLIPSVRLSRLCGCRHQYDPILGGWLPYHDEYMETSVPGIFVAGDCAGVLGALVALEEGRLAGIRACEQLGYIPERKGRPKTEPILKKLKALQNFELALGKIFAVRKGLFGRIADDTLVCRCKEITAGEIRKSIADGVVSMGEIKRFTMAGMGHCQGRMCENTIAEILSTAINRPIEDLGCFTPRPPVKPLAMETFQAEELGAKVKGFAH